VSDHLTSPDPNRLPYAHMSDGYLLAAYGQTGGEEGDTTADALLAEIQRRGLDI
jgi:hypothetical protein